jgi:hypothetical protein
MKRIINGFEKLSLADFRQKLDLIVTSMTGNAFFPTLQTDVQALATAATAYKVLATAAEGGDTQKIIERDAARKALTDALHSLGRHVTAVADDDVAKLASSGYSYTQERKATPDMSKPAPPKVELGVNNGEITCTTTRQEGMKSVNYYITTDSPDLTTGDGATWTINSSNKVKYTFSGLTAGQRYYIKVGLVGVRGQEVISDPVSYISQ